MISKQKNIGGGVVLRYVSYAKEKVSTKQFVPLA